MRSKMMKKHTQAVLLPISGTKSFNSAQAKRGFTAVEVAMVATVIAIIALLALPIFRDRAEAAREAAVFDELSSMAKMMLLAEADIGLQPRLQDLDNPAPQAGEPLTMMPWNGTTVNPGESSFVGARNNIINNWGGPYLSFTSRSSAAISSEEIVNYWYLADENGYIVVKNNAAANVPGIGTVNPIRGVFPGESEDDYVGDIYPLDPWGSPYVFFGKGNIQNDSTESVFNSNLLVSFGPDGVVGANGDPITITPTLYRRYNNGIGPGQIGNPTNDTDDVDVDGDFVYRF